jgi:hypothetical protein
MDMRDDCVGALSPFSECTWLCLDTADIQINKPNQLPLPLRKGNEGPGSTFSFHMRWYRIHFHFTTATAPTANNEQARLWFFVLCVCVYGHLGSPIKYLITRESTSNKLLVTTHTPAPHVPDADDVDMPLHLSPRALQLYLLQLQLSARSEI